MSEHEQLPETAEIEPALTSEAVAALVANHRRFLAFVQRRVGDRALAEEILQDAFVRSLDTIDQVRDTAIGWFYRVLRNAIIDHQRRVAAAARRLDAYAHEQDEATDDEHNVFEEGKDSMQAGWTGTFDRLEAYLGKA